VAPDEQQVVGESTEIRLVPAPTEGAPRAYANHLGVTHTPEDFTLFFGWYALSPSNMPPASGEVAVQPVIQISLPVNLIRPIIAVLQRQVEGYEANFGEIPPHPSQPGWGPPGKEGEDIG
jgi:hypothetical protein